MSQNVDLVIQFASSAIISSELSLSNTHMSNDFLIHLSRTLHLVLNSKR